MKDIPECKEHGYGLLECPGCDDAAGCWGRFWTNKDLKGYASGMKFVECPNIHPQLVKEAKE